MALRITRTEARRLGLVPPRERRPYALPPLTLCPLPTAARIPGPWRVEIPGWHPASTNQLLSMHFNRRGRLKRLATDVIAIEAVRAGVTLATGKRRIGLHFEYANAGHEPDADGRLKVTLDALRDARLIVDDSPHWCEWTAPTSALGPRKLTAITIEEVT